MRPERAPSCLLFDFALGPFVTSTRDASARTDKSEAGRVAGSLSQIGRSYGHSPGVEGNNGHASPARTLSDRMLCPRQLYSHPTPGLLVSTRYRDSSQSRRALCLTPEPSQAWTAFLLRSLSLQRIWPLERLQAACQGSFRHVSGWRRPFMQPARPARGGARQATLPYAGLPWERRQYTLDKDALRHLRGCLSIAPSCCIPTYCFMGRARVTRRPFQHSVRTISPYPKQHRLITYLLPTANPPWP